MNQNIAAVAASMYTRRVWRGVSWLQWVSQRWDGTPTNISLNVEPGPKLYTDDFNAYRCRLDCGSAGDPQVEGKLGAAARDSGTVRSDPAESAWAGGR